MRCIALAIILAGCGIEKAVRRYSGKEFSKEESATEGFLALVFFVCLIFGW